MCFLNFLPNFVSMKTEIDFLPYRKQKDLKQLVGLIRTEVKDVVMIILFGSYAKNAYVECDQRCEFGVNTLYVSDYDLLVVTKECLSGAADSRVIERFMADKNINFQTHPQIINENISHFNNCLSEGRYFYVDVVNQGIMLYNSGEYELATPRDLNYSEIKKIAQEYYDAKFSQATYFFDDCISNVAKERYQQAIFHLHQSAEYFLKAITLVYILYGDKEHGLEFLIDRCRPFTFELTRVFPRNTEEEKRLFELLERAYIEGRYNAHFEVTKADLEALIPKIELLREIVTKVCKAQFTYYNYMIEKEREG